MAEAADEGDKAFLEAERKALERIGHRVDSIEAARRHVDTFVQTLQDEIEHLYSELAQIRRMREKRGMT